MTEDAKGFLYPKVDPSVCVECGVCEKVCPFNKENLSLHTPITAYAAWNKNREQYLASSSGGAAHVFSFHIIKQGGVVYGCTSEGMHIRHIRVDNLSELKKLQGSKYVQSDVRGLFRQVKADLKEGIPVLFIGTPCQVAGLKNYIRRIPENLYLVDLVCHGVPSQKMLHEHITRITDSMEINQIHFRRGNNIVLSLTGNAFKYETCIWNEPYKDMYLRGFIDAVTYRPCCYQCLFAQPNRVSDITVGDFWGLQDIASFPAEVENGISVLLPSTNKGHRLINAVAVRQQLNLRKRSVDEAVCGNKQLQHPVKKSLSQRVFNILYPFLSFQLSVGIMVAIHRIITRIISLSYVCRR